MLPTQKTPPKPSLDELTVLVYGPSKFGKSSWCAEAENAFFLATEPGLKHLTVYQEPIRTWEELLAAGTEIAEGKHSFRPIVIDTIDNAYRLCAEYVCRKFKIEHESDLDYGKGYSLVNNEFYRVLTRFASLPYGLFLVSHSQDKEIETRTGKLTKIIPTLPDKARKTVLGMVDVILFGDYELAAGPDGKPTHRRVLRTKPTIHYEAGDRTGRLPEVMDLDFAKFMAAFAQATARPAPTSSAPASPAPQPSTTPAASSANVPATASAKPRAAVSTTRGVSQ